MLYLLSAIGWCRTAQRLILARGEEDRARVSVLSKTMENSKLPTSPKAWILFLILILILAGSVVFIVRSFQKIQDRAYLQTLESLAFNKYLPSSIAYDSVDHLGAWDGYLYKATEYQCVLGGHYGILAHAGTEADKTVFWLQPGEECWPDHPNCGKSDKQYTDAEGLAYIAAGANGGPFGPVSADPDNPVDGWNYIYVPTCDGSFISAMPQQIMMMMGCRIIFIMAYARLPRQSV